jgi:hypothetical protein
VTQVDGDQLGNRRFVFDHQHSAHGHLLSLAHLMMDSTVSRRVVAHVGALDDVDDLLGQVLGVVAHALDGLGHEHQVDGGEMVRGSSIM